MISWIIELSIRRRWTVFWIVTLLSLAGYWSLRHVRLDALPELGDTQVVVLSRWERSPDQLEDQVTYPIVSALLGVPGIKAVRGISDFGSSFVYVIFEEGTDRYWARARVQESLTSVLQNLPKGVTTTLGPDATALGWVFQYVLNDRSGNRSLADLRSLQDWYISPRLRAVPGVAEVTSVGGFGRQFQVNLDPNRLQAHSISVRRVVEALRAGNIETSGRVLEFGGSEYRVRGRGYLRSLEDIEEIVIDNSHGSPVLIRDVAEVTTGPDIRFGLADLNGEGETVSGIVVMRPGQNAAEVIERVRRQIHDLEPGLPPGVALVPIYDRSDLIYRAIDNLQGTLIESILVVAAVILFFLWNPVSASIPAVTIPITILISFIPFRLLGLTANIMSLGGIAIAVGALVDASIVVVEQVHKRLEIWESEGRREDVHAVVVGAIRQVAAPSFYALLVIAVSFLPVLALEGEEGRLFRPLAVTKTLSMVVAAILTITLDPALRVALTKVNRSKAGGIARRGPFQSFFGGRIRPELDHPFSRWLVAGYEPLLRWALRHKYLVLGGAGLLVASAIPVFIQLGGEFMPPLEEGTLLYMPSTLPGVSIAEAQVLLQSTDRILKGFPEVDQVLGKAGRADTATDPAPLSMLETVITLKPKKEWPKIATWYSAWAPDWTVPMLRHITPDHASQEDLVQRMNLALKVPGLVNGWTMPIHGRIEMLGTGIRTPLGLKISGPDFATLDQMGSSIEAVLRNVPGTRNVFAERTSGGRYLDIHWNRQALARNGLSMEDAQASVENAIGGDNVTTLYQGRERYPVNVRYQRAYRSDPDALKRVMVSSPEGQIQLPVGDLAAVEFRDGPAMIRNENGLLTSYVFIDADNRDLQGYLQRADQALRQKLAIPTGFQWTWSGQFESMQRVASRLRIVVPATILTILGLLYLNTRSWVKTAIIALAMPFSAVGAIWILHLLGYNMSVAVWVGLITLLGVDAETGVFMLIYLDIAYEQATAGGRLKSPTDLQSVIQEGAVKRLRPKFMTVATMLLGLVPILWSNGAGADVMKRIAAPVIGGLVTSFLLELLVYPCLYELWKGRFELRPLTTQPVAA
jgi:Cu(I)/Ag(I) efflux system membrane protein CusA/SilA